MFLRAKFVETKCRHLFFEKHLKENLPFNELHRTLVHASNPLLQAQLFKKVLDSKKL
jgi:hypothetical protein